MRPEYQYSLLFTEKKAVVKKSPQKTPEIVDSWEPRQCLSGTKKVIADDGACPFETEKPAISDRLFTRLHYRGIVLVYPVGRFDGRRLTMDVYSIKG